jgi:Ribosomal protein S12/S23
MTDLPLSS